ncbi:proteasome-activating nucleotidase [uncultured Caudovirales phage]|uniref:Proteasome-activating nucleotidase n=1 Tax=uncultured Caudovirales phage TaxID=2100421 RepID=A0A6J5Q1R8_9CAUD|nr:proteasome-activating nucleotidase [uncultured Caudovirales phage]
MKKRNNDWAIRPPIIDRIREIDRALEEEDRFDSTVPCCWSNLVNDEFAPAYVTIEQVPAGVYEVTFNHSIGSHTLKKQPFKTDELYHLPSPEIIDILKDIKNFWTRADVYRKYNFVHKRGILMYGEPGCGKSGIIQILANMLMELNGIVINIKSQQDIDHFIDFIPTFRKIEPTRPLVVILEDIDALAGEDRHSTSQLLNVLDGVKQIEGVVYIATTNYPEKLQERMTNRPSRFDRRYKIELPSDEIRRAYIINKLNEEDLAQIDIEEWVKRTGGMSLSHLKEVVVSVIVMGRTFEETMSSLEELKKAPKVKENKKMGFGS